MSLGVNQSKTYLNIREGKIVSRLKDSPEQYYDYVEGSLGEITIKEREFKGELVKYWYVELRDKSGVVYSLAIPYYSGVAKSLFNSLASAPDFTRPIKIEPYQSGEYTKIKVTQAGERLPWKYPELPPVEEVRVGDKTVKDDSKRMKFITDLVNQINATL